MTEAEKQVQWLEGWLVDPPPHAVYGEQWGKVTDPPMCGVFAHLCDHLALEPRTVVEIGPGGGRWTREIASRLNPHAKLILVDGTDAARPMLDNMLGHPFDLIVPPGSWKKDNGEWQGEQPPDYRDVLAGVIILLDPFRDTGHGNAADEQAKMEDLRRKLRGMEITRSGSGEDFVHPKAKADILNDMMRSIL